MNPLYLVKSEEEMTELFEPYQSEIDNLQHLSRWDDCLNVGIVPWRW